MTDTKLLELLHTLHARLMSRYGAPGVCLEGFTGRWQVFCSADLEAGLERALIDTESLQDELMHEPQELEAVAQVVVGEAHRALIVSLQWADAEAGGRASRHLSVSAWSPGEPLVLSGCVIVDGAGRPVALTRSGYILHGHRGGAV